MTEIVDELLADNPHYLEMALRCAQDVGDTDRALVGFAIFYRILALGARDRGGLLPRITPETRDIIASLIGELGEDRFILLATDTLSAENPCLLQMADAFARRHNHYLPIMKGFALLYKALAAQGVIESLAPLAGHAERRRGLQTPEA